MNDEANVNCNGLRISEAFQRQYATVVLQLKEANKQVSAKSDPPLFPPRLGSQRSLWFSITLWYSYVQWALRTKSFLMRPWILGVLKILFCVFEVFLGFRPCIIDC
jgi:hypothetical protein